MAGMAKGIFSTQRRDGMLKSQRDFDSGLEMKIAADLESRGYMLAKNPVSKKDGVRFPYVLPERSYFPDWVLGAGRVIEAKGIFDREERLKILAVKEAHPGLDVRFVFSNPKSPINKGSKTSYADWCDKHGIPWCKGPHIPEEWLHGIPKLEHREENNPSTE